MSTTIDSRVVEMRFDNKNFEQNVSTTMSTLEKLKQSLHLTGASKGLENVSAAAKNVNMNGLGNSVETVRSKFSALEVMGVTALANITNSAVNAGKRIVSALTIDPVSDGFREYELTLNAIQTTMAGTGKTAEEVEEELKRLDEYADKTVYSTADMLNNLPKFTNAGVELEKATTAMIGIANATALAGGGASQASIAFYNLGQAIGTGYLTRMDYNSVNNAAGIMTMELKKQLIDAAIDAGTLKKIGEDAYEAGNKTFTLQQLFIDGLQEQWATADVMMKVFEDYGSETTDIGKKAYSAAQDLKTFSQMMDSLKATAGTGWKDTWQLIFGGLDDAKVLWTGLGTFIGKILEKSANFRNGILEGALNLAKPFQALSEKIESVTKVTDKVTEALKDYDDIVNRIIKGEFGLGQARWDKLTAMGYDWAHAQNLVNEKLGDSYRYQTNYTEAIDGTNKAQSTTIEQLMKLSDAELKNIGFTEDEIEAFKELGKYAEKTGIPIEELVKDMDQLSGRSLLINSFKNAGKGLVAVFEALKTAWQDAFPPKSIEERSEALYNLIAALHKFTSKFALDSEDIKKQLEDGDSTLGKLARTFKGLFAIIDVITTVVGGGFKAAFKVVTTLLGYFNMDILDLTAKIGDLLVKFRDWVDEHNLLVKAIEWLAPYLEKVVKAISKFITHIKEAGYIERFANWIKKAAKAVGDWFNKIKNSKQIQGFINYLKKSATAIKDWVKGIKEADNIPKYILSGLVNGLKAGAKDVWNVIKDIGLKLLEKIKEVLGIQSPSTAFIAIGGFIMAGLLIGLQNGAGPVWNFIKNLGSKCVEIIKEIDFGAIIAIAVTSSMVAGFVKISNAILNFSKMFQGVGQMLEGLGDMFEGIGKGVKNYLNSQAILNFAIAIGILAASLVVLSMINPGKLWGAVGAIAALTILLGGLMTVITLLGRTKVDGKITKISLDIGKFSILFVSMSAALLLMALSMRTLGKMDWGEIARGGTAMIGLVALMVGFMAATKLLTKSVRTGASGYEIKTVDENISKIGGMLIKLSIALLLMVAVIKILGGMKPSELEQGMKVVTQLIVLIAGIMIATKLLPKEQEAKGIGKAISAIGVALLLMVVAVAILGKMDTKALTQGIIAMALLAAVIVGLLAATKLFTKDKNNADKIGKAMIGIGVALLLMSVAVKLLGGMDIATLAKGVIAMAVLGAVIVGLMAATKLIGSSKNVEKIGSALIKVAFAIGILALVTALLGILKVETLAKGIIATALLGGVIVGLMAATKLLTGSKNVEKIGKTLILVSAAIAILAAVAVLLGLVKIENLAKGIIAVGLLSGIMALLMGATKNMKNQTGTIIAMALSIAILAASAAVLALVDTTKLLVATVAIGVLLGMFRVLLEAKSNIQSSLGTLMVMTAAIAVMAGALYLLGQLPSDTALESTIALSVLMLAMAGVLKLVSAMKVTDAMLGIVGLAALGLVMWEFIAILKKMDGMDDAMNNVLAISLLMGVMSGVLLVTAAVGAIYASTAGIAATGLLGLAAMGLIMWEFIAILKKMEGMDDAMTNALAISTLMGAMSGVLLVTAAVGTIYAATCGLAATGLLGLAGLIVMIPSLIDELKKIEAGSFTPAQLETVIFATEALKAIAEASKNIPNSGGLLGALLGNNDLGTFAEQFPKLGEGLRGFVDEVGTFTDGELATITCAAKAVKILSEASGNINGQAEWSKKLFGDDSLTAFADQFPDLGKGIRSFINSVGGLDESQVQTINCAIQVVKDLASVSSSIDGQSGFGKWLTGDDSLSTFASQFPKLGEGIRGFLDEIGTFAEDGLMAISYAAKAVKELATVSKDIPNSGGWFGSIAGENDLGTFSTQFPKLATGLNEFCSNIGTFTEVELETVKCAAKAVSEIAKASESIPNSGGWLGVIIGDNDMGVFAEQFPTLGSGLSEFINNIGTFTPDQVATVNCAADAIVSLASASSKIDGQADWAKKIFGDNSLSGFSEQFGSLGKGIASFVSNVGTFNEEKVTTVNYAVRALDSITSLANTDIKSAKTNIPKFGESIIDLAKDIATFCEKMPDSSTVKSAMEGAKSVFTTMSGITQTNSSAMQTLGKSLADLAKSGLKSFIEGFTSGSAKSEIKKAGETMIETLVEGMEKKTSKVEKACKSIAEAGADAAADEKSEFKSAGKDVVEGFAKGIELHKYIAKDAAAAMAAAAAKAAKDELKINSPSKVFRAIAYSIPEGFAMGIDKYGNLVENSSISMAKTAISGVKDSIARIADIIDSDMDAQPTIRPVLDLSDVRSNAGLIGGLLNTDASVGVLANVGSISTMMNRRIQNGSNLDVISAINKLRKDIGNINNTTYTINGITYDDGSNIADAVQSIVRAAKMERRV